MLPFTFLWNKIVSKLMHLCSYSSIPRSMYQRGKEHKQKEKQDTCRKRNHIKTKPTENILMLMKHICIVFPISSSSCLLILYFRCIYPHEWLWLLTILGKTTEIQDLTSSPNEGSSDFFMHTTVLLPLKIWPKNLQRNFTTKVSFPFISKSSKNSRDGFNRYQVTYSLCSLIIRISICSSSSCVQSWSPSFHWC